MGPNHASHCTDSLLMWSSVHTIHFTVAKQSIAFKPPKIYPHLSKFQIWHGHGALFLHILVQIIPNFGTENRHYSNVIFSSITWEKDSCKAIRPDAHNNEKEKFQIILNYGQVCLITGYGMTETSPAVFVSNDPKVPHGSVGMLTPNAQCKVHIHVTQWKKCQ